MPEPLYRLAPSTVVEPLISSWAMWVDMLSPLTYSLHLKNYQLPLLRSYLENPAAHVEAASDPELAGASFANVPVHRSGEVQALMERTEQDQVDCIQLAEAMTCFYDRLVKTAKGQCLDSFYADMPEPLHGYVELVYDYNCNPIIRPLESFLYSSPYYKPHLQSLRILEQKTDSSRPFFLNTPRVEEPDQIEWRIPFDCEDIDQFFELDNQPRALGFVRDLTGASSDQDAILRSLLTCQSRPAAGNWEQDAVRVRYFGHACVLVQIDGVSVLTDPWVAPRSSAGSIGHYSFEDLPDRIDFAVITHGHHDHFVPETLLRLRKRIKTLIVPRSSGVLHADPSLKLAAQRLGFRQVMEVDPLDRIPFGKGEIVAAPFFGEHADFPHAKSAYAVRAGGKQILFAADSNCLDRTLYRHLRRNIGSIDLVFLGMECVGAPCSWLYGALLPFRLPRHLDQSRRTKACDCDAALAVLEELGSSRAYVYAMGAEPWLEYRMGLGNSEDSEQSLQAQRFIEECRKRNVDAVRLFAKHEIVLSDRS